MPARSLRAAAPWFVLVLGLALTGAATAYVSSTSTRLDRLRFDRWVRDATTDVEARVDEYTTLLQGVAGLFAASDVVNRDEFHAYVQRLGLQAHYPGIRGIGYARLVKSAEADRIQAQLSEQRPGFRIWPRSSGEEHFPITYLEPEDELNLEAIGFDMYAEPLRHAAMETAASTGEPAATRKVTLVQELTSDKQPGFLVYLPIYRGMGVPATPEARRAELSGYAFSPFRVGDFLGTVFPPELTQHVMVRIYDAPRADPRELLYASTPPSATTAPSSRFTSVSPIRIVGGRQWTMEVAALPGFGSSNFGWAVTVLTLLGGTSTTVVLFGVTLALAQAQRTSERAAVQLQRSERALVDSNDRLELALAAGDLFAFTWELHSDRLLLRGSAQRILGREPGTAAEFFPLVHEVDRDHVARTFAQSSAGLPNEMEFRIARPDGEVRWVRDRAIVQVDDQDTPRRVIGICADITGYKQIERQLRSLNETLEQRVADRTLESEQRAAQLRALAGEVTQAEQRERRRLAQVLHDHLQQLLVAALMRMGVMLQKSDNPRVHQGLEQVEDLIRQAIESSRSLTVELSPPVLYDVGLARGLEWLARSMNDKHELEVELDLEPGADTPDEDLRAFLFQATRELLFNIVKHAGTGTASVVLGRSDGQLLIEVSDDGPGFDASILRVRGAKAEHFGLFSIQQRLELLGGKMQVESIRGRGTRIVMRVPARLPADPSPHAGDLETDQQLAADKLLQNYVVTPEEGAIRVVVADDHEVLREGLAAMLETQPDIKLVGEASDGREAIELVRELRPDAVVLDVTMPEIDGIEAARRIKSEWPDVCIIGLSMHEAQEVARAMKDAGAVAYLTKSAPAEELVHVLRAHCAGRGEPVRGG